MDNEIKLFEGRQITCVVRVMSSLVLKNTCIAVVFGMSNHFFSIPIRISFIAPFVWKQYQLILLNVDRSICFLVVHTTTGLTTILLFIS